MEVIYTGLHQTPEQVVEAAIQEAPTPSVSPSSGAHMTLVPRIIELLAENEAEDILVFVGGTIPKEDITRLKELGVGEVFPQDTNEESCRVCRAGTACDAARQHAAFGGLSAFRWSATCSVVRLLAPERIPGHALFEGRLQPLNLTS